MSHPVRHAVGRLSSALRELLARLLHGHCKKGVTPLVGSAEQIVLNAAGLERLLANAASLRTLFLNGCASIRRLHVSGQDCVEEVNISGCHQLLRAAIASRNLRSFTALHCENILVRLHSSSSLSGKGEHLNVRRVNASLLILSLRILIAMSVSFLCLMVTFK